MQIQILLIAIYTPTSRWHEKQEKNKQTNKLATKKDQTKRQLFSIIYVTNAIFISPLHKTTQRPFVSIYNYCIFCMPRQNYMENTLPPILDMNIF